MNSINVDFSELNELKPFFSDQEKIMASSMSGAFNKGGAAAKKILAAGTPSPMKRFNVTLGAKKTRSKTGIVTMLVGYFGSKLKYVTKSGKAWDAFFLLYWRNYGTLRNRDSGHQFQFGIRPGSTKKLGGIRPVRFFDQAADSAISSAYEAIDPEFEKQLNKNVFKYGFK